MTGLTYPQFLLIGASLIAFVHAAFQMGGKYLERLFLLLAGIIFLAMSLVIDYLASMLGLVPSRSIPSILLFREAPLRDILIPIAYGLIAVGIGSLLGKLVSEVFARMRL